jgi:peptidyl-prolyl cis-trans isomerase SurA
MFRIIRLNSRTEPHKASLATDYSRIQAAAIEEKQARFVSDWIMEKIDETFIVVDPLYQDCENLQGWIDGR